MAKLCHFGCPVLKAKLICQKYISPGNQAEVFIGKIFIPVAQISVEETEISVYRLAHLSFSYEHIAIFTKEIGVRRNLGNRASPVNRAYMKRPLIQSEFNWKLSLVSDWLMTA